MAAKTEFEHLKDEAPERFRDRYENRAFIGNRIKMRRMEIGMSQSYVAAYFGSSREWVSVIESGKVDINAGDLAVFAKLLDTDPVFFVDRVYWQYPNNDQYITQEERQNFGLMLTYYQSLTSVLQAALVQVARGLYETMLRDRRRESAPPPPREEPSPDPV